MARDVSLIPPRTVTKAKRLPPGERRMYLQELIGSHEQSLLTIKNRAHEMAEEWAFKQEAHQEAVIQQLRDWLNE